MNTNCWYNNCVKKKKKGLAWLSFTTNGSVYSKERNSTTAQIFNVILVGIKNSLTKTHLIRTDNRIKVTFLPNNYNSQYIFLNTFHLKSKSWIYCNGVHHRIRWTNEISLKKCDLLVQIIIFKNYWNKKIGLGSFHSFNLITRFNGSDQITEWNYKLSYLTYIEQVLNK